MDVLARAATKGAAKCDMHCELQSSQKSGGEGEREREREQERGRERERGRGGKGRRGGR